MVLLFYKSSFAKSLTHNSPFYLLIFGDFKPQINTDLFLRVLYLQIYLFNFSIKISAIRSEVCPSQSGGISPFLVFPAKISNNFS